MGNGAASNATQLGAVRVAGFGAMSDRVAHSGDFACAINNGGVYCWGRNSHGQLGVGLSVDSCHR